MKNVVEKRREEKIKSKHNSNYKILKEIDTNIHIDIIIYIHIHTHIHIFYNMNTFSLTLLLLLLFSLLSLSSTSSPIFSHGNKLKQSSVKILNDENFEHDTQATTGKEERENIQ
jgi:hypothetical protein